MTTQMPETRRCSNCPLISFHLRSLELGKSANALLIESSMAIMRSELTIVFAASCRRTLLLDQSDDECEINKCAWDLICVERARKELVRFRHNAHRIEPVVSCAAIDGRKAIKMHDGEH
jgi:hypothetical protein